jgi:alkanesulfonate monooxygenase SsuD/methylene tetrahydromethanopterin reductase-like flavin-dependent oxidoreductase (luciferase family)
MIMTLDRISGGRVDLGVGAGGETPKQFEAYGVPLGQRGPRTDEYLDILTGLWTQDLFDYSGAYFSFEGISLEPKPLQQPHPPIWIGGRPGGIEVGPDGQTRYKSKTAAARRAGRYGQAWIPYYVTVEQVAATVAQVREVATAAGRDPDAIEIGLNNMWWVADSFDEALAQASQRLRYGRDLSSRVQQYDILGGPKDVIKRMEDYIAVGVTHFACRWLCDAADIPAQMQIVSERVMPHFR